MNDDDFIELLETSIDWETKIEVYEDDPTEDPDERDAYYVVKLTLWEKQIKDVFRVSRGKWYAESGDSIMVDTPLTVWQWVAMKFCDQIGGNVE